MPQNYQQEILAQLNTISFGRHLIYEQCLPSSNKTLMEMGKNGAPEGLLLLCEEQSAGRGRENRSWFSPPGRNLYFSLLLRPTLPPRRLPELALLSALALHKALKELLPEHKFGLKWPNDLWHQGRKISAVIGVQMGENNMRISRILNFLNCCKDTWAHVHNHGRGVRRS